MGGVKWKAEKEKSTDEGMVAAVWHVMSHHLLFSFFLFPWSASFEWSFVWVASSRASCYSKKPNRSTSAPLCSKSSLQWYIQKQHAHSHQKTASNSLVPLNYDTYKLMCFFSPLVLKYLVLCSSLSHLQMTNTNTGHERISSPWLKGKVTQMCQIQKQKGIPHSG